MQKVGVEQKRTESELLKSPRTILFVSVSVVTTLAFCIYNVALYIRHTALWNLCIALYYFVLFCVKISILLCEKAFLKAERQDAGERRVRANLVCRAMFFAVDFALAAPIALMSAGKRDVSYSTLTAIAFATYTVYKLTAAIVNLKKARKSDNLSAQTLRALNFKDAILSVVALQYVLIETFGGGEGLRLLCQLTSFALWGAIVLVSVFELIGAIRAKNALKEGV